MCFYKRKEFKKALEYIDDYLYKSAERIAVDNSQFNYALNMSYLSAVCNKGLQNFEESSSIYIKYSEK